MIKYAFLVSVVFITTIIFPAFSQDLTPFEIVKKAEEKMQGEKSSQSAMTITIVRPTWTRNLTIKTWTLGKDYALTLITSPASDKGKSFLKRKTEMWSWDPTISRLIKMPPSMLSEGWMGSDYTNDDIMQETSLTNNFKHKLLGEENVNHVKCYKIELVPKEESAVTWGKINVWISKEDFLQMKAEYYDDDMLLVKTETASDIKLMDDRKIPTRFEIIPADEPGNKTVVIIDYMKFNVDLKESFFSQQNMKNIR